MSSKYLYEKELDINPEEDYCWLQDVNDIDNGFARKDEFIKQREDYGFDERDIWSLDYTFVAWIYPRLKMFRETLYGHPQDITMEEWENIIDTMIDGFGHYLKNGVGSKLEEEKVKKALDLFKEYFFSLWN